MPTTINGTSGNDTLVGTSGDDIINGLAGNDTLTGGDGNDILVGGAGDDVLDGGPGRDLADFQSSPTPVYVALFETRPQYGEGQDTLVSIEDVRGSAFDDQIFGDQGDNHLMGMAGNDILYGGGGVDLLEGGLGDDLYFFEAGDKTGPEINDSGGYDRIRFSANSAYVFVVSAGDIGVDRVEIGGGVDLGPSGGSFTEGLDIDARAAPNGLMIVGSDRANSLWGSAFADVIDGRLGQDRLSGGLGNDILSGGDGKDVFVDTAAGLNGDTISDLAIGETIIITDANFANFSYSLVGHTLTYTGGSLTLGSLAVGRLIASAAPGGGVQLLLGPAIIPAWPSPPGPEHAGQLNDSSSTFTVEAGSYYYSVVHPGSGEIPIGARDSVVNRGSIFL